jgi:hypothetical protein
MKATPSELASVSDIIINRKVAINKDIAHPATLSNPAILRDPAILSNPATLSNPEAFSNADDIMLTSPSQSKEVHDNNITPTPSNPPEGKITAVIAVMRGTSLPGLLRPT